MTLVCREKDIQSAVLEWLNTIPNCRVWRQNVGVMEYLAANGKKRLVKFGQPGMADLTGLVHGLRLEVEIKRPGRKPTPEQDAWLGFVRMNQGIAFWADSLGSCVVSLRSEFQKRNWKWLTSWEVW